MSDLLDKIRAGEKIQTDKGERAVYIGEGVRFLPVVGIHTGLHSWDFVEILGDGKIVNMNSKIVLVKPMKQLWARRYKMKKGGFVWAELRYAKEGQPPNYYHDVRCEWIDEPVAVGPLIEEYDG